MIYFNGKPVPFGRFPNGESYIEKSFFERNKEDLNNVVTLKYEGDDDLFKLLLVRKALPCWSDLRILYLPYSRMDRDSDVYPFTLKTLANFINSMEWPKVTIYEPHSDVSVALLDRVKVVNVIPRLMQEIVVPYYQVFFPDAGAQKRYSSIFDTATEIGRWRAETVLVGSKRRDFATGKILETKVYGERYSDTVVIVDDLCSKGGTFIGAAKTLRDMDFKTIMLVVAHCEETIFQGEVLTSGLIDYVLTTDSILTDNDGADNLEIFPCSRL